MMKFMIVSQIFLLIVTGNAFAITLGEFINPLEEFLECKDLEWYETVACEKVAEIVNTELNDAGIQIDNGSLIFQRKPIPGLEPKNNIAGKDCHSLDLNKSWLNLTLKESSSLDLSFSSISEPVIMTAELLTHVYARANLKENRGYEVINPFPPWNSYCAPLPSDYFYISVAADVNAKQIYTFSLEPKLQISPEGDYIITIKPIFDVITSCQLDQDWDIHGRDESWLSAIYSATMALTNTPINAIDWISGQDSWDEFAEQLIFDHGIHIIDWIDLHTLGVGSEALLQYLAESYIESETQEQAGILDQNLENQIYAFIKEILSLDENGEYVFIVPKSDIDGRKFSAIIPAITLLH